jgi:hypothetical protein
MPSGFVGIRKKYFSTQQSERGTQQSERGTQQSE